MDSWYEQRRADKAADARLKWEGEDRAAQRARAERRSDREERRAEKAQQRRDRAARKQARTARREKALTPANVYAKGTLALVGFSAAASLPAQIIHFVSLHWMLFPIGPAIEGLAWVMAAGVAYADEKKLAPWVRWLLRGLTLGAASFAAHINYTYGLSLTADGLTPAQAQAVGTGLAAVSLAGPLVFEIRQWVRTLTASVANPARGKAKERARHERQRRRDHKTVVKLAERLMSAAPFGELPFEDAFTDAWEILHGTRDPGMTPQLHAQRYTSRHDYTAALDKANGSPISVRGRLLEALQPARSKPLSTSAKPQVVTDLPPSRKTPSEKPQKAARRQPPLHRRSKGDALPFHALAKTQAAETARLYTPVNGHHH